MLSARLFGLLAFVGAACGAFAQQPLAWHALKSGQKSNEPHARRIVLQNADDFAAYWQTNFPSVKQPTVRWSRERVVAIHLGHRGSVGYTVVVSQVVQEGNDVAVYWDERLPTARASKREQPLSPYLIIAIPSGPSHVVFHAGIKDPYNEFGDGNAFPKKIFLSGLHSLIKKEATRVIEDQNTLTTVWGNAFGRNTPAAPADFTKVKLVAIFLGQRPTPGYQVSIDRIARIGPHEIQVFYSETKPEKGAILPQMITNPFLILQLPKTEDQVSVERS